MAKHPQMIFPALTYDDPKAAVEWLQRAFGFEKLFVFEDDKGQVGHAELELNGGVIMLGGSWEVINRRGPRHFGGVSQTVYAVVDDPDGLFERAKAAGAEIIREPEDMEYGSREFSCRDLEGHIWSFGTYRPEVSAS